MSSSLLQALLFLPPLLAWLQYLIPMLGMLLGNACSGVAVGLSTILEELSTGAHLSVFAKAGAALCCMLCYAVLCLSCTARTPRWPGGQAGRYRKCC